jgi:hypothetical protein
MSTSAAAAMISASTSQYANKLRMIAALHGASVHTQYLPITHRSSVRRDLTRQLWMLTQQLRDVRPTVG